MVESFRSAALVEVDGEVKSFGVLRYITEAVLYITGGVSRAAQIDVLISQAIKDSRSLESKQIYVFVEDEKLIGLLEKRYKFRKPKATTLILDLE